MTIDSLTINLITLIPTAVFAIVIEKHYTAFWTGFWNFFALFATGLGILFLPAFTLPSSIALMGWNLLPWILVFFGIAMMFLSYFIFAPIARIIGSSHITTAILLATYLFQYTVNPDVFWIALVSSFIGILAIKMFV